MKIPATLLVMGAVILAMLACGCTTQAPEPSPPTASPTVTVPAAIPDLTGTWTGSSTGYLKSAGFLENAPFRLNITKQEGQAFKGMKEYVWPDGKVSNETIAGILAPSGEIYMSDDMKGINIGRLTAPDTLEIIYLEDGPGEAKAMISHLTRERR
ncbi:MAG: hypothetical protein NT074_00690 [Methanomicrobiales archaeon]|nr:hypothetical protein [Methanomicrobiales archaeon]